MIDPTCEFLLDTSYESLFEAIGAGEGSALTFRCKGCTEPVERWKREAHHTKHKRERERQRQQRKELNAKAAAKRLEEYRKSA